MPLHDWTKVNSGLYHHFHQGWCWEISASLNRGRLPNGHTALVEQRSGTKEADVLTIEEKQSLLLEESGGGAAVLERPKTKHIQQSERDFYAEKASRIAIHHRLGRVVAYIEIVSPGNKGSDFAFEQFISKVVEAIRNGIHVLVVDPFPPGPRDPDGIHSAIWNEIESTEPFEMNENQDRILASYEADRVTTAFVEPIGMGDVIPDMPLFIASGAHVLVPLEESYERTWTNTPKAVQRLVGP